MNNSQNRGGMNRDEILSVVRRPSVETILLAVPVIAPDGKGCPYKQLLVFLN